MIKKIHVWTIGLLSLLILAAGCAPGYQKDSRFQSWFLAAETRCVELYGSLPTMSAADRQAFMQLTYDTYRKKTGPIVFADQLGIKYSSHKLVINCLANAFPRQP